MSEPRHVAIVGGGITGLTAAYELKKRDPSVNISLFEASDRLGGNIKTDEVDGFIVEHGPDSFVTAKPFALALAKELGLESELIETPEQNRHVSFVRDGKLTALPEGFVLGIPTRLGPLLRTPLLSPRAKFRAALEPVLGRAPSGVAPEADESIQSFFERHVGAETTRMLVGPLLGGIYAGDTATLSINATLPQLKQAEARHGSIVVGQLLRQLGLTADDDGAKTRAYRRFLFGGTNRAPKKPAFYSFRSGMKRLIEALAGHLPDDALHLGVGIQALVPPGDADAPWQLTLSDGRNVTADAVLLAVPIPKMAELLPGGPAKAELETIRCISTATAVFAFERDAVEHPLDGLGFIVPKGEGEILASTWISSKWPHRAPEGKVLLRAFLGGPEREEQAFLPDAELTRLALAELRRFMGRLDDPLFSRVYRYHHKSPQPAVGHLERVQRVHEAARGFPRIYLCAGGLDGIGIADCARHAKSRAEAILSEL